MTTQLGVVYVVAAFLRDWSLDVPVPETLIERADALMRPPAVALVDEMLEFVRFHDAESHSAVRGRLTGSKSSDDDPQLH